jgi:hypothetical protein
MATWQPDDARVLQRNQPYDFFVNLELPDSRINRKSGVFMVELLLSSSLYDVSSELQSRHMLATQVLWQPHSAALGASRPAYIHYQSFMFRMARKLLFFFPYLVGWWDETVPLTVHVLSDAYDYNATHPLRYAGVRITSPTLQVYSASLVARAKMTGVVFARVGVGRCAHADTDTSCTTGSSAATCSVSISLPGAS